jgi:hypothetical protein
MELSLWCIFCDLFYDTVSDLNCTASDGRMNWKGFTRNVSRSNLSAILEFRRTEENHEKPHPG